MKKKGSWRSRKRKPDDRTNAIIIMVNVAGQVVRVFIDLVIDFTKRNGPL